MLWTAALAAGDELRIELAGAMLNLAGFPGGERVKRSVDEIMVDINARS